MQEKEAGSVFPTGVRIGVVSANVALADGSEESVSNGVDKDISVGVAIRTAWVVDLHTAEHAGATFFEGMDVVTDT